jgi:O-antigen/teichoic acid export membrane protein
VHQRNNNIANEFEVKMFDKNLETYNTVQKNIFLSGIFKGLKILFNFIQVPVTLGMIGTEEYGIWLTIFSIINFISVMDIGIGSGFKNKLVDALTISNTVYAKQLISTTYILVGFIYGLVVLLFIVTSNYINWYDLLNLSKQVRDITYIVNIAFVFIALNFVVNLHNQFLSSIQRNSYADIIGAAIEAIILIILLFIKYSEIRPTLLSIVMVYSVVPFMVQLLANIYTFTHPYHKLMPSFYAFDKSVVNDVLGLGLKFFVIQVAGLIMFQSQQLFIAQKLGMEAVTTFQLNYRYFGFSFVLVAIFTTPYYVTITKAFAQKNIDTLTSSIQTLTKIWAAIVIIMVVMLCVSPYVFSIWLDNKVSIPITLSILTVLWLIFHHWCNIYMSILSSVSVLNLQVIVAIIEAILSIFLVSHFDTQYGLLSLPLTNITILFVNTIILYFQVQNLKLKSKNMFPKKLYKV